MIRIIATITLISMISMLLTIATEHKKEHKHNNNKHSSTQTSKIENLKIEKLLTLEYLLTGKTLNLDLSKEKTVLVFLNKQTVRDYNQVNNFANWVQQKGMNIKVYTILNGENKEELKNLAKSNNILDALFDKSKLLSSNLKVEKYPVAYYLVNGQIVDKTEKLDVGHLKQMVIEKKGNSKETKEKCNREGCCGGNCNCGPNCKC